VNLGVGGALQTGFQWAYERGYDVAVQLDADGQHDPVYLSVVLAPVLAGRCDVCIGSRFVSSTGYRAPWNRRPGCCCSAASCGCRWDAPSRTPPPASAPTTSGSHARLVFLCLLPTYRTFRSFF
jgi:glycosyltransferase involved in cell wall biosynthesis